LIGCLHHDYRVEGFSGRQHIYTPADGSSHFMAFLASFPEEACSTGTFDPALRAGCT
jgi:hypothetical protein